MREKQRIAEMNQARMAQMKAQENARLEISLL